MNPTSWRQPLSIARFLFSFVLSFVVGCGAVEHDAPEVSSSVRFGLDAEPGSYAFVMRTTVEAHGGGESVCASSLIGPRHLLTAAHCVFDLKEHVYIYGDPALPRVRPSGTLARSYRKGGLREFGDLRDAVAFVHPTFRDLANGTPTTQGRMWSGAFDLAVVQLPFEVKGTTPARVASYASLSVWSRPLTLAGYGFDGTETRWLTVGDMVLKSVSSNSSLVLGPIAGSRGRYAPRMIEGDSGGPLLYGARGPIVGVSSCGDADSRDAVGQVPSVATAITDAGKGWIEDVIAARVDAIGTRPAQSLAHP